MQTIINIVVFLLILTLIIIIHEFGHFITAKLFGVYCSEFSMGMGPKLFGKKRGETEYQIRLLPIGGYVAMAGEADQEDNEDMKDVPFERTLKGIKTWKKCVIMLAGVFMNFVLSIVLLIGVYSFVQVTTNDPIVGDIIENSGAAQAGIKAGDHIKEMSIGTHVTKINSFNDIQTVLDNNNLKLTSDTVDVKVTYTRDSKTYTKNTTATYSKESKSYIMGVKPNTKRLGFIEAVGYGFERFWYYATVIFTTLAKLITDSANTFKQLSGPVGIYNVTSTVTESGSISTMCNLIALLSANIGMFNLLPIPGLDGSQVLFALVEKIMGREIPIKIKYVLQLAGLALVFGLMIFVTINDVSKLFQ